MHARASALRAFLGDREMSIAAGGRRASSSSGPHVFCPPGVGGMLFGLLEGAVSSPGVGGLQDAGKLKRNKSGKFLSDISESDR